jgi:hypothetical protein
MIIGRAGPNLRGLKRKVDGRGNWWSIDTKLAGIWHLRPRSRAAGLDAQQRANTREAQSSINDNNKLHLLLLNLNSYEHEVIDLARSRLANKRDVISWRFE